MAVGRFGQFVRDAARAVTDVAVWGRLLLVQMRRVGVDSLPVALFIAAFTGVVLALQASYTFTGTVPLYFVGTLVGKTMMLELGPVLVSLALAGRVGASMAARSEEHTSELQSQSNLVCRLLLEKKNSRRYEPALSNYSCPQPSRTLAHVQNYIDVA